MRQSQSQSQARQAGHRTPDCFLPPLDTSGGLAKQNRRNLRAFAPTELFLNCVFGCFSARGVQTDQKIHVEIVLQKTSMFFYRIFGVSRQGEFENTSFV
jgi:hypothetical protein